ncbi:MAG: T9SS type A sorting domain-containing protein, partial [Bacteroidetes bacterium]|nr:T9SS type A sorting domain-containing protein [Bacteroidota bacterium]
TLQGDSIMIEIDGDDVTVNGASVTMADLEAQNGVVHVIDAVLLPPLPETVVDIVVESEAHTTLETAVVEAELAGALSAEGPFTVFAPTDAAFDALPDGTLADLLADPTGELAEILQYHVVSGKVMSGDLTDGMKVETLQGDSIMIEIDGEDVTVNGASVTMADLEAQNGVVHVIDAVLLPPVETNVNNISIINSSVKLYPTIARDQVTLEFTLDKGAKTTIDIYNLKGTKVQSIELGNLTAGEYREYINVQQLDTGIYLLNLNVGNDNELQKFEVSK